MKLFQYIEENQLKVEVDFRNSCSCGSFNRFSVFKSRVGGKIAMVKDRNCAGNFLVQSILLILNILIPIKPLIICFKDHAAF